MHLKTDTSSNAHFASVPTISHSRNAFTIADKHVSTMQFDQLFPIYNKFIYPGDTISGTQQVLARLQTQIAVLYDDLYFDVHAWFVPMRLIQTNWARYQFNAQPAGPSQDNTALTSPKIDLATLGAGGFASKSLYDYFGYPTKINTVASTQHINNYLGRAYNLIWNENYRDENLQNPAVVDLDDGPDLASDYVLRKRGKRHDKLTSALTAAQKGTPVTLPLGTSAPITGSAEVWGAYNSATINGAIQQASPVIQYSSNQQSGLGLNGSALSASNAAATGAGGAPGAAFANVVFSDKTRSQAFRAGATAPFYATGTGLIADLSAATAATLNQVRQSYAVQHLLEADARGGTRDVESIQHRWGVTVPDFRLQRPEYLGGQTFTFDGHVVPQTSATVAGQSPQATLTMFSQTQSGLNITHSFVEHGVFMVLISARSNITYQEFLPKEFSYRTRYDWYQPEFANLGEVAVLNREIYFQGIDATDTGTFGFQEYAYELRYGQNKVTSEMRSNYAQSLDSRHMADDYSSLPTLGSAWIESNTAISRNIAVAATTSDPIQLNMMFSGTIARTLPMYSIPGLKRL